MAVFHRFGSWLLNLDEVEAVMYVDIDNKYILRIRMKTGKEYDLYCASPAARNQEREKIWQVMQNTHPAPVSRYEVEMVVQKATEKVRGDIRTLKKLVQAEMEGLRNG